MPPLPYFRRGHRFHVLLEAHVPDVRFVKELQCVVGEFIDDRNADLDGGGGGRMRGEGGYEGEDDEEGIGQEEAVGMSIKVMPRGGSCCK